MELTSVRQDTEPLMFTKYGRSTDNVNRDKARQTQPEEDKNELNPSKGRFTGWRLTLLLASLTSIAVLAFNLGFILWAAKRHHLQNNQGVLYEGDCDVVRKGNIAFHLGINILGTALLAASNYCMVR